MWFRLVMLLLLVAWGFCGTAVAQTLTATPNFGGPGGSPFRLACPQGSVMTGIRARHGAWIDALAPVCSRWVRNAETLGEIEDQPFTGGDGGSPGFIRCEGRRGAIVGLLLHQADNRDRSIGHILVDCGDYKQPEKFWNKLPGSADFLGQSMLTPQPTAVHCLPGMVAAGLYGRSGAYVDRVGLLCIRSTALSAPANTTSPSGPRCKSSFVWREARPQDFICVPPESRTRVARENASAAARVQPGGGAFGSATCRQGYVWREVDSHDFVCVTPESREQVRQENALQMTRQAND